MKRLVLFVVALVFAFSTTVMAADKPVTPAAEPAKVEKAAGEKALSKKEAAAKKAADKKEAAAKKAEKKKEAAAPADKK